MKTIGRVGEISGLHVCALECGSLGGFSLDSMRMRYKEQLLTLLSPALAAPIGAKDSRQATTALFAYREYAADSLLPFRRWENPGVEQGGH